MGDQLLKLGAGQILLQVLRTSLVRRDERQIHRRLHGGGQLNLRFLGGLLQPLQCHGILAKINALLTLELIGQEVDQLLIEVVAAEMRVAGDGKHLEHPIAHIQHRHVERAATKVKNTDLLVLGGLVQTEGQGRGRRLGQHAYDVEPGDFTGVFGCLALGIIEICGHGNHGVLHRFPKIRLGRLLQVAQHHRRDLLRGVFLAAHADLDHLLRSANDLIRHHLLFRSNLAVSPAHETLDREDRVLGVGHLLVFCGLSDKNLAFVGETHHRGSQPRSLSIDKHFRLVAFHDGNYAICRSKIDSNGLCHVRTLLQMQKFFGRQTGNGGSTASTMPESFTTITSLSAFQ